MRIHQSTTSRPRLTRRSYLISRKPLPHQLVRYSSKQPRKVLGILVIAFLSCLVIVATVGAIISATRGKRKPEIDKIHTEERKTRALAALTVQLEAFKRLRKELPELDAYLKNCAEGLQFVISEKTMTTTEIYKWIRIFNFSTITCLEVYSLKKEAGQLEETEKNEALAKIAHLHNGLSRLARDPTLTLESIFGMEGSLPINLAKAQRRAAALLEELEYSTSLQTVALKKLQKQNPDVEFLNTFIDNWEKSDKTLGTHPKTRTGFLFIRLFQNATAARKAELITKKQYDAVLTNLKLFVQDVTQDIKEIGRRKTILHGFILMENELQNYPFLI